MANTFSFAVVQSHIIHQIDNKPKQFSKLREWSVVKLFKYDYWVGGSLFCWVDVSVVSGFVAGGRFVGGPGSVVGGVNKTQDKCGNDSRILFKDTGSLMNEIKIEMSRKILATTNKCLI